MATLSDGVEALARYVALDQITQDIKNNQTFAKKSEIQTPVIIQELLDLYNGYTGQSLDYRDYLDETVTTIQQSLIDFGNGYMGVTNGAT